MTDESTTPEVLGLELTFAELAVLPLLRGVGGAVHVLEVLELQPAIDGSVEARSGVASLAVRRLLDVGEDELVAVPALVLIADLVVNPERCAVLELRRDGDSEVLHVLEGGEASLVHRRVAHGIHLFSPIETGVDAFGLAKRLAEALRGVDAARLTVQPVIVEGERVEGERIDIRIEGSRHPTADGPEPSSAGGS